MVAQNFMQKYADTAETSTKIIGCLLFYVHPVGQLNSQVTEIASGSKTKTTLTGSPEITYEH